MVEARILYRVVLTDPPTLLDFQSRAAAGLAPPVSATPDIQRLWDGISTFATEAQARCAARRYPLLGRFIARLTVSNTAAIRCERTLATAGHYTLWGDPGVLLGMVDLVVGVR